MFQLEPALRRVIEMEGSDLHLKVPSQPLIRRHGRLEPIPGSDPLAPEDTETLLASLLGGDKDKLQEFTDENEVDFAFGVPGLSRFRANAFRQRGTVAMIFRLVRTSAVTMEELGLRNGSDLARVSLLDFKNGKQYDIGSGYGTCLCSRVTAEDAIEPG